MGMKTEQYQQAAERLSAVFDELVALEEFAAGEPSLSRDINDARLDVVTARHNALKAWNRAAKRDDTFALKGWWRDA